LAIIILDVDDKRLKIINMLTTFFLLSQLPIVAIRFLQYGIDERTQGAYAIHDGSMSAMLPIVVIFYCAAYYFLYRQKLRYIAAAIGFVLFSIAGAKRVMLFLYPLQFLSIYYYIYLKGKRAHLSRKAFSLALIMSLTIVVSSSILYLNESLNPERRVGGTVDPAYALNYAKNYTTREYDGYSAGRYSTSIRIFKALINSGPGTLLFGFGPGKITPSFFDSKKEIREINEFQDRLKFIYGNNSITYIALEYGILGLFVYGIIVISFARMCWRYYKYEVDPYWKAFAAGSVGFAFSMFLFAAYTPTAFLGDTMPALYFYTMAVVYIRLQRIKINFMAAEHNT
jgi:hypothetical protein